MLLYLWGDRFRHLIFERVVLENLISMTLKVVFDLLDLLINILHLPRKVADHRMKKTSLMKKLPVPFFAVQKFGVGVGHVQYGMKHFLEVFIMELEMLLMLIALLVVWWFIARYPMQCKQKRHRPPTPPSPPIPPPTPPVPPPAPPVPINAPANFNFSIGSQ